MAIELVFRPQAEADLNAIDDFIAQESPERAFAFVQHIRHRCAILADFPELGRERTDLHPGLRILSFDRRVVVAYVLHDERVEIARVLYRGRDVDDLLTDIG